MIKRLFSVICVGVVLLTILAACGGSQPSVDTAELDQAKARAATAEAKAAEAEAAAAKAVAEAEAAAADEAEAAKATAEAAKAQAEAAMKEAEALKAEAEAGAAAPQEIVNLVFRQNDPPNQIGEALEAGIAEWNAANPNIQVTFETVPWSDAQTQFVREASSGSGPDVLQLAFVWTRDLAKSGALANLDSYIEADPPGAGIDDFLGVELGELDGSVYGIPWSVDTFVMAYRPDLLEDAGLDGFPETWDKLMTAAEALTVDKDGDGSTDQYGFCFPAGSGSNGGMWFLANYYLWSNDYSFIEEGAAEGNYQMGLSAENIAEAMSYFNQFFAAGYTPESMIGIDSWGDPEYTSSLGRGDCAIIFVPPAAFNAAREQSEMPVLSAADPAGPAGHISHMGGRALAINANTEHPDEAWAFLTFLTEQEWYANYYSSYFPPQKSLLAELEFDESLQGYADQLPHAITFNTYILAPPAVSAMWEATNREFGAVYSGQKEIEQASTDLAEAMQDLLNTE